MGVGVGVSTTSLSTSSSRSIAGSIALGPSAITPVVVAPQSSTLNTIQPTQVSTSTPRSSTAVTDPGIGRNNMAHMTSNDMLLRLSGPSDSSNGEPLRQSAMPNLTQKSSGSGSGELCRSEGHRGGCSGVSAMLVSLVHNLMEKCHSSVAFLDRTDVIYSQTRFARRSTNV